MEQATTSLPDLLQYELARRQTKNPNYSLRAFARSLQLAPSSLSRILNGKRVARGPLVQRLGAKLGLGETALGSLLQDVRFDSRRKVSPLTYQHAGEKDEPPHWLHWGVLALTEISGFKPSFDWVAARLNVSLEQARGAVAWLLARGLLAISKDGEWTASPNTTTLERGVFTTDELRESQRRVLRKALEALNMVPIEMRDQSSMTLAFAKKDLPRVRDYIRKFRRRLDSLSAESTRKDSVYTLSVSFFPLTSTEESEHA